MGETADPTAMAARIEAALARIEAAAARPRPPVVAEAPAGESAPGPDVVALAQRLDAVIAKVRAALKEAP